MYTRLACFMLLLLSMGVDAQETASSAFFPVGVWFEGKPEWAVSPQDPDGVRAYYDRCFRDLAARGFNTATVTNCPEALWPALLESADKHDIRIVLDVLAVKSLIDQEGPFDEEKARAEVHRVVEAAGRYPSLLRYQTRDEPTVAMIPNWARVNRLVGEADPAHPAFSCFCSPDAMKQAIGQARPEEIVFDIYPQLRDTPAQNLGDFVPTLDRFTEEAGQSTRWVVLQSFAKPGMWRYPTAEELRAEVYLSLVAGARGVFLFIYQCLPHHPEQLEGLVTPYGAPTPLAEAATALARELRTLSSLLLTLQPSTDTAKWSENTRSEDAPPDDAGKDFRLTAWTDPEGRDVLIIASLRLDRPVPIRIDKTGATAWHDALTEERIMPADESISFVLSAGHGRILVRGGLLNHEEETS